MTALDLAIQPCLFAVLFGFVVLLPLFEQTVRRVVVGGALRVLYPVSWGFRRGTVAVAVLQLFQKFVVRFRSVLPLCVILRALLYAVFVLHQWCFLPISVSLYNTTRQAWAHTTKVWAASRPAGPDTFLSCPCKLPRVQLRP